MPAITFSELASFPVLELEDETTESAPVLAEGFGGAASEVPTDAGADAGDADADAGSQWNRRPR